MLEKHEFDVRTLIRGSRSPDPKMPILLLNNDDSPPPSVPPPPYSVGDEYPLGLPRNISATGNSACELQSITVKSGSRSLPEKPFSNVPPSNTLPTTSAIIYNPTPISHNFGQKEYCNVANLIFKLQQPATDNKIMGHKDRGHFRSEIWETPDNVPQFATAQPTRKRRYISRTFPADYFTQPCLDECYDRPYGYDTSIVPLPPKENQSIKSTSRLSLELEYSQKQSRSLQSAYSAGLHEFNMLAALLPRLDGSYVSVEASVWGKKERLTYKRMQLLEKRLQDLTWEGERMERMQKRIHAELEKRRETRELLEMPLRIIARDISERNVGRRWLRGEIPWADGVNMGRESRM
ncbi:e68851bf-1a31-4a57-8b4f-6aed0e0f85d5-CDS [Sclerotinia trifoliorum]|uniref:E68851bf-1a31-4a57-8b4f-6aed0e0f85d5-CDS n=1 Tax=Sclerotinia trifoliorum TaxID=28548 RepID=A0A8H2ZYD6_9HELO|nr:e68851bf-1a31-4a57-8b4f-6aed0e0f85d5-CDS [Sclerotinia trifoliorum]